ncbi:DUF6629 family protein [Crocinitomix catalasitica]|uniref:DUF6629 family protein n=1 Tax=Crocinitomix catalasitica TaxID=184607 RepID=UPI0004856287|nr:DUF6629 family protein [Crocinitomix catalasitica]
MCFSTEASFAAAAVITTSGIIAYKKAGNNDIRFIAIFPIFFGFHQFIEGWVWLASLYYSFAGLLEVSTYGFIIFAWIIWPVVIPVTLWRVEHQPKRKKILFWMTMLGCAVTLVLSFFLLTKEITAEIVDHSIIYDYGGHTASSSWFRGIYVLIVTLPNLISSRGKMWMLFVMNMITYSISRVYFNEHVVSVWCFFAAISSIIILYIVHEQTRDVKAQKV